MPANDDFMRNPRTFMNANVVLQMVPNEPQPEEYTDLLYKVITVVVCEGKATIDNLPDGKVCWMRLARAEEAGLRVYWCPYVQNGTKEAMLANEALYVFTPTMNGCTFGVGSYVGNGIRRVAHVNAGRVGADAEATRGEAGARLLQSTEQARIARDKLGLTASLINPGDYQPDEVGGMGMQSTTFGQHDSGGDWSFYTLKYRKIGSTVYHHGGVTQRL
jgi:hypothetical protein